MDSLSLLLLSGHRQHQQTGSRRIAIIGVLAQILSLSFRLHKADIMAEINKLSVEKTLNKIRADDAKQSMEAAFNDKIDVLDEDIGRMRAQRLRLERHQGKHHQDHPAPPAPLPRYTFGKLVSRLFWFLRS